MGGLQHTYGFPSTLGTQRIKISAPVLDELCIPKSVAVQACLKVLRNTLNMWEGLCKQLLVGCDERAAQVPPVSGWSSPRRLNLLLSSDDEISWCLIEKIERKMIIEFYCKTLRQDEE